MTYMCFNNKSCFKIIRKKKNRKRRRHKNRKER